MTTKKARSILSGKLIFGDTEQIEAKNFLNAVEDCVQAYLGCEYAENHVGKFDDDCRCVFKFHADVVSEARARLR